MSLILAMCSFALSMSISPGPVNLITLSTGINYGFIRTLPFVAGASIGFSLLLFLLGLGLSFGLEELPPSLIMALQGGGALFIAYMGYGMFSSSTKGLEDNEASKSLNLPGFAKGFLLQWLNPKAWIACISGITAFKISQSFPLLILFTTLYLVICFASIGCWAALGNKLKGNLKNPLFLQNFNRMMGLCLILVAGYLLLSIFPLTIFPLTVWPSLT